MKTAALRFSYKFVPEIPGKEDIPEYDRNETEKLKTWFRATDHPLRGDGNERIN